MLEQFKKEIDFESFTCERLWENPTNKSLLNGFSCKRNPSMKWYLQRTAPTDDRDNHRAVYLIKENNKIVMFFTLQCGLLVKSAKKELRGVKKVGDGNDASYIIENDKIDVSSTIPAIEIEYFCINDSYRKYKKDWKFESKDISCSVGVYCFYKFVAPLIIQLGKSTGLRLVYLFAADQENGKLEAYYSEQLKFRKMDDMACVRSWLNQKLECMTISIDELVKNTKLFWDAATEKNKLPPPRHIAIIMDGNGRWAKNRGLPRTAGHAAGAETFRRIANHCRALGVEYLTVYAFSTENWKRSEEEVGGIMKLLKNYLLEAMRDMEKNRVRFCFFGDLTRLSPELQELCAQAAGASAEYDVQVNFCLNYGGRDEIVRAAREFARKVAAGECAPEALTEENFSDLMYSAGVPDPELVIRPSGELRLSNFLLWQSAYSEFVYMNVLWPDFKEKDLDAAIAEFHRRNRRFGGV